jgi:thiol-disulfide isomerase/thioredoxin
MRPRLALGLLTAVVISVSLPGPCRAEDEAAATFKADLAKLLDRYNDDAASGRLDRGIALCSSRVAVKGDDIGARLELASFKMAKDDFDGAVAEAERAAKDATDPKSDEAKQARAIALAAFVAGAELRLQKEREKDMAKAEALQQELQPKVTEREKALVEIAGSEEQAVAILTKEQERVEKLKGLAEVGSPPHALDKKDTAGKEIKLDAYAGKVLLIDFWATWCGPCVEELPNVLATYEKWNAKGFEVLGISLDEDRAALDGFLKEKKVPWRQYFDGKGWENEVAVAWGIHAIPQTYLIDHTGKVRFVGAVGEELGRAVEELIGRAEKAAKAKTPEPAK